MWLKIGERAGGRNILDAFYLTCELSRCFECVTRCHYNENPKYCSLLYQEPKISFTIDCIEEKNLLLRDVYTNKIL